MDGDVRHPKSVKGISSNNKRCLCFLFKSPNCRELKTWPEDETDYYYGVDSNHIKINLIPVSNNQISFGPEVVLPFL